MEEIMSTTNASRCQEIQSMLPDFVADQGVVAEKKRLGPIMTGEIQGHLSTCELCDEMFADLIYEAIDEGKIPLEEAPIDPSTSIIDQFFEKHGYKKRSRD